MWFCHTVAILLASVLTFWMMDHSYLWRFLASDPEMNGALSDIEQKSLQWGSVGWAGINMIDGHHDR